MNRLSPILEINSTEEKVIEERSSFLKELKGFGPPDLCVLTKEYKPSGLKKLISKGHKSTAFHYIYGVNTSSIITIGAYFKRLIEFFSQTGERIVSGSFFIFDVFSQCDIRVSIVLPGNINEQLFDPNGNQAKPLDIHWKGCYLSSCLRFFHPSCSLGSFVELFKTPQEISDFFQVALEFLPKLGFVPGESKDIETYGPSLLFPCMNKYLLSRKRFQLHQEIYKKLIDSDPLHLVYLTHSSIAISKYDEILNLLSNQIKLTPHAFPLYFSIAKAYYKKGEVESSLQICKYLIELNLDIFDYWELLIKCFLKQQNYSSALICINTLPLNTQSQPALHPISVYRPSDEKVLSSADPSIWNTPKNPDFFYFDSETSSKSSKEKIIVKKLDSLPASSYRGRYKRAYKLLVRIEKAINWENLLKLRISVFSGSKIRETEPDTNLNDLNRSGLIRTVYETAQAAPENDPSVDYSLRPAPMIKARDFFLDIHTNPKLSLVSNPNIRRLQSPTIELLHSLHADLKSMHEWQVELGSAGTLFEDQKSKMKIEVPYTGEVWIRRGILAERLLRYKSALRAYDNVVLKGFSLFAWFRIIKLNLRAGVPISTLKKTIELFRLLELQNVKFETVPPWIEVVLSKLCNECGFKQVLSIALQHGQGFKVIIDSIQRLKYWRVSGT